jgi:hypothetical protein
MEGNTSTTSTKLTPRPLFGGAMRVCIPSQWRDVSEIRQVPDNQEVFQDCTFTDGRTVHSELGILGSGGCIVIEILEREDGLNDDSTAEFYFKDLAEANGSIKDANTSGENAGGDYSIDYTTSWNVGTDTKTMTLDEGNRDDKGSNIMPQLSVRTKAFTCIGHQNVSPLRNRTTLEEGKSDCIKVELCVLRLEQVHTDLLISLSLPSYHGRDSRMEHGHDALFLEILRSFQVLDWSLFG